MLSVGAFGFTGVVSSYTGFKGFGWDWGLTFRVGPRSTAVVRSSMNHEIFSTNAHPKPGYTFNNTPFVTSIRYPK